VIRVPHPPSDRRGYAKTSIGILHFTDLHFGMAELKEWWPYVGDELMNDLEYLSGVAGPWDLVAFTGDFAQKGSKEEFEDVRHLLKRLWKLFDEKGYRPRLLTVPGNHDLQRPGEDDPVARTLQREFGDPAIQRAVARGDPAYLSTIESAFEQFELWSRQPGVDVVSTRRGLLPGDFAATFVKNEVKVGVLGLNTAFLQLSDEMQEGSLAVLPRQIHAPCDDNLVDWAHGHDFCVLLTHHPPSWLSAKALAELNPERGFVLHLCGHMHEPNMRADWLSGAQGTPVLLGASLYSDIEWGGTGQGRISGYSACRLEPIEGAVRVRVWPRIAASRRNSRLRSDVEYFQLPRDREEIEVEIPLRGGSRQSKRSTRAHPTAAEILSLEAIARRIVDVSRGQEELENYAAEATRRDAEREAEMAEIWRTLGEFRRRLDHLDGA